MKLDFLLLYEIETRELESLVLLKNYLEKKGYKVAIKDAYGPESFLFKLYKPQVVVVPWLRNDKNVYQFSKLKKEIKYLVNLQWEQIFNLQGIVSGIASVNGLAKGAKHLCWGRHSEERLLKILNSKNVFKTGGLHLDFCRTKFTSYYKGKECIAKEFDLDEKKQWSLFISSFTFATMPDNRRKEFDNEFCSVDNYVAVSQKSKSIILKWIEELLDKNDQIEFIYRPHPVEVIDDTLYKIEEHYNNFHIIENYSVKQWIKVCDVINTWISTSIAEIYYMGKACNIVRPIKIPKEIEVEIMRDGNFVSTKEEFLKKNNVCNQKKNEIFPIDEKIISEYYDFNKEKASFKRVGDYLISLLENQNEPYFYFDKKILKKYKKKCRNNQFYAFCCWFVKKTHLRLSNCIHKKNSEIRRKLENMERYIGFEKRVKEIEEKLSNCIEL